MNLKLKLNSNQNRKIRFVENLIKIKVLLKDKTYERDVPIRFAIFYKSNFHKQQYK